MRLVKRIGVTLVLGLLAVGVVFITLHRQPDRPVEWLAQRWGQPPSEFEEVAGMNVHFRDMGWLEDPAPIVLLHGTSSSLHTWEGWTEALVKTRRVISFDLPGFGLTGPHPRHDYSIGAYIDFVIAVLNKLGIERFVLAGNSLGGHIAWATAVEYPNRVEKLILVNAAGYGLAPQSVPLGFRIARLPLFRDLAREILPRAVIRASVENVFGDPSQVTPGLVDRYFELTLREGNREALAHRMDQYQPGAMQDQIGDISQPTLILWGEKDQLIPVAAGQRFAEDIANSRLRTWDDLGHVPQEEDPARTVREVLAFLGAPTLLTSSEAGP